jgi:hypothetical protein
VDIPLYERLGHYAYLAALSPYYGLLLVLAWRYRIILRHEKWWFYFLTALLLFGVLGLLFEWIAGVLHVWVFPPETHTFQLAIPIFGWITGHRVPIEELLWIAGVIPLFYFLYLWATLVFYDIIYVVDERGEFYKREERWRGFLAETRIRERKKFQRGQDFETTLWTRPPGIVARLCERCQKHR